MDIKSLYQTQESVSFKYLRDGEAWYETDSGFLFPVPLPDIGSATLAAKEKATLFVRYIRRHLAVLEAARLAQAQAA